MVVVIIAIVIVVMIIPVAVGMPTMAIFIPPPFCVRPAIFSRFVQLLPRIGCLPALPSVMLYGFVQPMIGFGDTMLACVVISAYCWCAEADERARQRHTRKQRLQPIGFLRLILHFYFSLLNLIETSFEVRTRFADRVRAERVFQPRAIPLHYFMV
jgi:hypothetical protein